MEVIYYGFCPNPVCRNIDRLPDRTVHWDEPFHCALCGTPLVGKCPECQRTIHKKKGNYCVHCGKPFKTELRVRPQPQQNLPLKGGSRKPSK